jgi:phosphoribosylformylglycinamidine synthase
MEFRDVGRTIVLLRATEPGDITDVESEFGSSEYAKEVLGAVWGYPPELDLEREAALQRGLVEMIHAGLVESAHDCSSGGLAVALVEPAFVNGIGLRVDVASHGLPAEFALFGEDASRVVIACDSGQLAGIKEVAAKYGLAVDVLGETVADQIDIKLDGRVVVSAMVAELSNVYESALESTLRTEPESVAAD